MFHDELSLNKEVNRLYDRLQQAHEERDKYKKALDEIEQKVKRKNVASHIYIQKIIDEALK